MTFDKWETIVYTCIFLVPGYIIKEVIDTMTSPKPFEGIKHFYQCIIYSVINIAVWCWLDKIIISNFQKNTNYLLYLAISNICTSLVTGFILGFIKYKKYLLKILDKFHIHIDDPIPTAWDNFFSRPNSYFVGITLKDGSNIYGLYASNSCSSSYSEERDLYIEKLYNVNKEGKWKEIKNSKGMLILKDEISTIEFYEMEAK